MHSVSIQSLSYRTRTPANSHKATEVQSCKKRIEATLTTTFSIYRAGIAQGLKDGKLYGFKKGKLMSNVADAFFSHKSNPTGEELRHVGKEMAKNGHGECRLCKLKLCV